MPVGQRNRRAFIAGLGGAAAWPVVARAQATLNTPIVGVLVPGNREPFWTSFREAMRDLGYSEGANIRFEFRSAEGKPELLPDLAAQLVRSNASVIVAYLTPPTTFSSLLAAFSSVRQ
jgi:putative ABC transport system substrate-binding protein